MNRQLTLIHVALALLAPIMIFLFIGCYEIADQNGEAVDYGPEISTDSVLAARSNALKDSPHADPYNIKAGEFVHFSDTQDVEGGALQAVVSDTSQTITERDESDDEVIFTLVEHKVLYSNSSGTNSKESRESKLHYCIYGETEQGHCSAAPNSGNSNNTPSGASSTGLDQVASQAVHLPSVKDVLKRMFGPRSIDRELRWMIQSAPERALSDMVQALVDKTTYHRLRVSDEVTSPPALVQARPNCADIPNCRVHLYHIGYDVVQWTSGKADRIIVDETLSPDVPYLAEQVDRCLTLLVPIGTSNNKALLKECTPVEDFRFQDDSGG